MNVVFAEEKAPLASTVKGFLLGMPNLTGVEYAVGRTLFPVQMPSAMVI
jgi:hypothetical protein